METESRLRACNKCGWVHFGRSLAAVTAEVAAFNEYFDLLSRKQQEEYYGGLRSSISHYQRCHLCGEPYINFRDAMPSEVPEGSTLQPILMEMTNGQS